MTLKVRSLVSSERDARDELDRLNGLVDASNLQAMVKTGLRQQIESTFQILGQQLSVKRGGQPIRSSRVLSGEGYHITIQVGPRSGFATWLSRLMGR